MIKVPDDDDFSIVFTSIERPVPFERSLAISEFREGGRLIGVQLLFVTVVGHLSSVKRFLYMASTKSSYYYFLGGGGIFIL